jgi:hypothetical protein
VLGAAYPGLSDRGWTLLSRNWALFFLVLAVANEVVWRTAGPTAEGTQFWLGYKLWGALPATLLFAIANIPMLLKHGANAEVAKADPPAPAFGLRPGSHEHPPHIPTRLVRAASSEAEMRPSRTRAQGPCLDYVLDGACPERLPWQAVEGLELRST